MGAREIHIAAAVILDDRNRMLVVKKRGSDYFMQPGGKIEPGEAPVAALRRELSEEVGFMPVGEPVIQGLFRAPAANEPGATVVAHIFSAHAPVPPRVGAEIESLAWLDADSPGALLLAPLTRDHMLPLARRLAAQVPGELR